MQPLKPGKYNTNALSRYNDKKSEMVYDLIQVMI